jgi:hypothetical protein
MHRKLPLYIISIEELKLSYQETHRRQVNNTNTSEHLAGNDNLYKSTFKCTG